jgi:hypothetical protein
MQQIPSTEADNWSALDGPSLLCIQLEVMNKYFKHN